MASINRQTRSDFQFCIRNANNSQSLGVHTHFCGRCKPKREAFCTSARLDFDPVLNTLNYIFSTEIRYMLLMACQKFVHPLFAIISIPAYVPPLKIPHHLRYDRYSTGE